VIQKQKNKKHEMCKTIVKMNFYYANIYKHEHEKNITRLWCRIVLKTNVEHIERNKGSYFYLFLFKDLASKSFQKKIYACIE
jgi:hypothetical protein